MTLSKNEFILQGSVSKNSVYLAPRDDKRSVFRGRLLQSTRNDGERIIPFVAFGNIADALSSVDPSATVTLMGYLNGRTFQTQSGNEGIAAEIIVNHVLQSMANSSTQPSTEDEGAF